uniref:Bacterial OB-fold domain-containing protein n=1 Tax=Magnetococcus massalia (strain MO-1) TaxID=451514 RepID=A0A1S7LFI4_MAGMO|nr:Conserved exported protein of unknown function [Candidatus Magnetococcus massalia]
MSRFLTLAAAALFTTMAAMPLHAEDAVSTSIADLYKNKASLKGKQVELKGKVVKVNNNIMNRNFLHLQDGSGDMAKGNHDLTITSDATATMGQQVTIVGTVAVDNDFGYGYVYPLIVEKAVITPAK